MMILRMTEIVNTATVVCLYHIGAWASTGSKVGWVGAGVCVVQRTSNGDKSFAGFFISVRQGFGVPVPLMTMIETKRQETYIYSPLATVPHP